MIRGYCDACGKEIKDKTGSGAVMYFKQGFKPQDRVLVPITEQVQMDLCPKCCETMLDFLKLKGETKKDDPPFKEKGLGGDTTAISERRIQQP